MDGYLTFFEIENVALNKRTRVKIYDNSLGADTVNGMRRDCNFSVNHAKTVMRLGIELNKSFNINGVTIFTPTNSKYSDY